MAYKIIVIDEKYFYRDLIKIPKNIREQILHKISTLSEQ
jgi:hypothetical protein